jgi:hypothetical protein
MEIDKEKMNANSAQQEQKGQANTEDQAQQKKENSITDIMEIVDSLP